MGKVMTGSRAKVYIDNDLVGIFDSCSWSAGFGSEAQHILGRFSPDEITITSAEAVSVNCSGYKVINHGIHKLPKVPKLQDLLNLEGITLAVVDRQTGEAIVNVQNLKVVNHSGGVQSRASSKVSISYLGTRMSDEDGDQDEVDANQLPE